jgi:hypothetical protein
MTDTADNAVLTFGKYKGNSIARMIEDNPAYMIWLDENVAHFSLTKEQRDRAYDLECSRLAHRPTKRHFDPDADYHAEDRDLYPEVDLWYGADD